VTGVQTYAALTKRCDDAGGFVQITSACAGNNACAGFSYGDWATAASSRSTAALRSTAATA